MSDSWFKTINRLLDSESSNCTAVHTFRKHYHMIRKLFPTRTSDRQSSSTVILFFERGRLRVGVERVSIEILLDWDLTWDSDGVGTASLKIERILNHRQKTQCDGKIEGHGFWVEQMWHRTGSKFTLLDCCSSFLAIHAITRCICV